MRVLALGLLLLATPAAAGNFTPYRHAPIAASGRAACVRDAHRLCSAEIGNGVWAVVACFQAKRQNLSQGCSAVLAQYGQ